MKPTWRLLSSVAGWLIILGSAAMADWNPGDAAKWVQLPDASSTGLAIQAMRPLILADDFVCTQTGPITSIHIWGEWYSDVAGPLVYNWFNLTIYSDIPADQSPTGYSMPGEVLWTGSFHVDSGNISRRVVAQSLEWLYNPQLQIYAEVQQHDLYQYNFTIPAEQAFIQQAGAVYWLGVQEYLTYSVFGWKTSLDHWNDDAVWCEAGAGGPLNWQELRYPQDHPFAGQSIDLAFVIVPEPTAVVLTGLWAMAIIATRRIRY